MPAANITKKNPTAIFLRVVSAVTSCTIGPASAVGGDSGGDAFCCAGLALLPPPSPPLAAVVKGLMPSRVLPCLPPMAEGEGENAIRPDAGPCFHQAEQTTDEHRHYAGTSTFKVTLQFVFWWV